MLGLQSRSRGLQLFLTFQSLWFAPGKPKGFCHCEAGFLLRKTARILYWLIPTHVTFGRGHH